MKPKRNETNFQVNVKNEKNELFSILKRQNIDIPHKKTEYFSMKNPLKLL
jgi:hypothetical protein